MKRILTQKKREMGVKYMRFGVSQQDEPKAKYWGTVGCSPCGLTKWAPMLSSIGQGKRNHGNRKSLQCDLVS